MALPHSITLSADDHFHSHEWQGVSTENPYEWQGISADHPHDWQGISAAEYPHDNLSEVLMFHQDDIACYAADISRQSFTIYSYISLAIIALGIICNTINGIVFASKELKTSSSNVYLFILAIVDTGYLTSVFLSHGLANIRCLYFRSSPIDIFHRSTLACKTLQYLLDVLSHFSTSIVVVFTVERLLACYRPFLYKRLCTARRACVLCALLLVMTSLALGPHHVMMIGRPHGLDVCAVLPAHEHSFALVYTVEVSVFKVLPVLIIGICNALIILHTVRRARRRNLQRQSTPPTPCTPPPPTRQGSRQDMRARSNTGTTPLMSRPAAKPHPRISALIQTTLRGGGVATEQLDGGVDRARNTTLVLTAVSTYYIICIIPLLVHFFLMTLQLSNMLEISYRFLDTVQSCGRLLYITAFSMNLFLYTLTSPSFRSKFMSKICRKRSAAASAGERGGGGICERKLVMRRSGMRQTEIGQFTSIDRSEVSQFTTSFELSPVTSKRYDARPGLGDMVKKVSFDEKSLEDCS